MAPEISRRWSVIDLLDVLKDVAHVTEYTDAFTSVVSRTVIDEAVLQRRLLLCLPVRAGDQRGIKRVADGVAAAALPPGHRDDAAWYSPGKGTATALKRCPASYARSVKPSLDLAKRRPHRWRGR